MTGEDDYVDHVHEQQADVSLEQNGRGEWRIVLTLTDTPVGGDPCTDVIVTDVTMELSEASSLATMLMTSIVAAHNLDAAGRN